MCFHGGSFGFGVDSLGKVEFWDGGGFASGRIISVDEYSRRSLAQIECPALVRQRMLLLGNQHHLFSVVVMDNELLVPQILLNVLYRRHTKLLLEDLIIAHGMGSQPGATTMPPDG